MIPKENEGFSLNDARFRRAILFEQGEETSPLQQIVLTGVSLPDACLSVGRAVRDATLKKRQARCLSYQKIKDRNVCPTVPLLLSSPPPLPSGLRVFSGIAGGWIC